MVERGAPAPPDNLICDWRPTTGIFARDSRLEAPMDALLLPPGAVLARRALFFSARAAATSAFLR